MPSHKYHGLEGTWSSSQLKVVLEDEEVFIKKYITGEIGREEREAFDTGTYFHTVVLEPHKVDEEVAVYEGKVRYGKAWQAFKKANQGKTIITISQRDQGDYMAKAVKDSPVSTKYLKGSPELSLFVELLVSGQRIYAPAFKKVLGPEGWESVSNLPAKGTKWVLKVRADTLGEDFISDLKSTSGKAKDYSSVRSSISRYQYDLSAALYLDLFSLVKPLVKKFVWIFASKEARNAAAWVASKKQILVGRAKWSRALLKIDDLHRANWEVVDYLRVAEPLPHELEWLEPTDADLL